MGYSDFKSSDFFLPPDLFKPSGCYFVFLNVKTEEKNSESTDDSESLLQRIFDAALPAIEMYEPISAFVDFSLDAYDFTVLFIKIGKDIKSGNRQAFMNDFYDLAELTATVSLSILFPTYYSLASHTYDLGVNVHEVAKCLYEKKFRAAAYPLLGVIQHTSSLYLKIYKTPEIIIVSLLSKIVKELVQSATEFHKGRTLEAVAALFYASLKFKAIEPHVLKITKE